MNLFAFIYPVRASGILLLLSILLLLFGALIFMPQDSFNGVPKNLQKYIIYDELPATHLVEVDQLKLKIKDLNAKREVRNWKKFGVVRAYTTLLVVQVDRDVKRLQYLIVSLAQVQNIDSVLLVFSHSYYHEGFNRLIRQINFCKVMQIFYPHSLQLHPDRFPGVDPGDCTYDSQTTDSPFCQERNAKHIEHKQHWWWKANFVFDHMEWSPVYTGTIIFLEEDQFIAPDLLYMLKFGQRSLSYFPDVEIMSFGRMYTKNFDPHLLSLECWKPPFDVGIAFNKTTWRKILALSSFYCMYDDSSWSYSLLNLFTNFSKGNANMVACVFPRVMSTKQFGAPDTAVTEISRLFRKSSLYPDKVEAVFLFGFNGRVEHEIKAPPKGNGGWNDIRDQLLCLDPLITTTDEYEVATSTYTPFG